MVNKLKISILYNNGASKSYIIKDTTGRDLAIQKYLEEQIIQKCYQSGINGYLSFYTEDNESVNICLKKTSEIKFEIISL